MWKAPNRPNNVISQTFNDGIVTVYAVSDTAQPGYKPKQELVQKVALRFSERRLGIERYYKGRQNQIDISRVVRTPRFIQVSNQDVAIIQGVQYRIDLVQHTFDVYPPSMDLTLVKIQQEYEIKGDDEF